VHFLILLEYPECLLAFLAFRLVLTYHSNRQIKLVNATNGISDMM
jgi:hypothetical protein